MEALIPILAALAAGISTSIIGWILSSRERRSKIDLLDSESHENTTDSLHRLLDAERENTDRQRREKNDCWDKVEKLKQQLEEKP